MSDVIVIQEKNPGCLIQLIWFLFVGWWAGQLWIVIAWVLILTVLGIPLAVMMLNRVPKVIALRGQADGMQVSIKEGTTIVSASSSPPQRSILVRAIYFLLIGWWLSAIWMELAYLICLTIIGLPIGFWMFDRVPALVSLRVS
jgi:uncharacterized membrane protein YccF (DUF307 family)